MKESLDFAKSIFLNYRFKAKLWLTLWFSCHGPSITCHFSGNNGCVFSGRRAFLQRACREMGMGAGVHTCGEQIVEKQIVGVGVHFRIKLRRAVGGGVNNGSCVIKFGKEWDHMENSDTIGL